MIKTLVLDIETAPHLATVWGLWQQNVAISQVLESGYTLCWAAKWHGAREILFDSTYKSGAKRMVRRIHGLLDSADEVVHYNGRKFDIPTLNKEFLLHGMTPPSPSRQVDLLSVCRSRFRMASNKLDYVSQALGIGHKLHHKGHELWLGCMDNDAASWRTMERYNRQDVVLLEKLYDRLIAWRTIGVNRSVHAGTCVCPKCSSDRVQARGLAYTNAGSYPRFQCRACGTWFRGNLQKRESTRSLPIAA